MKNIIILLLICSSVKSQVGAISSSLKDSNAIYFISQSALINDVDISAINTLTRYLKGYSLYSKMSVLYPFLGTNSTSQSKNLINPSTYSLTFYNSPNFTVNGFEPNGTSQYANTGYQINNINNSHLSLYTNTNNISSTYIPIGMLYTVSSINNFAQLNISGANGIMGSISTSSSFTNTNSIGSYVVSRTSSTNMFVQKNGNIITTNTASNTATSQNIIYIGARNDNGTANFYSPHKIGFVSIGYGLTTTEANDLYTIIEIFRNIKGR